MIGKMRLGRVTMGKIPKSQVCEYDPISDQMPGMHRIKRMQGKTASAVSNMGMGMMNGKMHGRKMPNSNKQRTQY